MIIKMKMFVQEYYMDDHSEIVNIFNHSFVNIETHFTKNIMPKFRIRRGNTLVSRFYLVSISDLVITNHEKTLNKLCNKSPSAYVGI